MNVKLQVEVSRIYGCQGAVTTCHGMLAIFQASRERRGEEMQSDLRRALYVLCMMRFGSVGFGRTKRGAVSGLRSGLRSGSMRGRGFDQGHEHVLRKSDDITAGKEHWVFREGSPFDRLGLIDELLCNRDETFAIGGSGSVVRSTVDGLVVAVKYWNMRDEEGRQWFINELDLDMNEYLLKTVPELFGDVLPQVVAIRRLEPFGSALVSGFVGEELEYVEDEILVGGIAVEGEESEKLYEAGLTTIRKLQGAGVVHQDISSDNLCVTREVDEKGDVRWRV